MNDFILHVNSTSDATIAQNIYGNHIQIVKLRIHDLDKLKPLFQNAQIIIDTSFDGYPVEYDESQWNKFFLKNFKFHKVFLDKNFIKKPTKDIVEQHLIQVLDHARSHSPYGIIIPQLNSTSKDYRKINKMLAELAGLWKSKNNYSGIFVYPAIFTSKISIFTGKERTNSINLIEKNYNSSSANSIWVVDSSLQDQAGISDFEKERFPAMIDLHQKIKSKLAPQLHIAGPYWGLNILLWARNIISTPAFSLGTGFQHYSPSGRSNMPTPRMAIPPLLRWAKSTSALAEWLAKSSNTLKGNPEELDFLDLINDYNKLKITKKYKEHVAKFYLNWFLKYQALQIESRSIALYQDLSKAYVIGTKLSDISSEESSTRKSEIVARQLMLNCL